ncbi:U-box domain protein [Aspergillus campestris IBT 28561]|uniref:U-box domain protein n=1 Tax=Aspergillus campestris (strain IBT 28561) TaxID=1392248 RepID=A0A2I1CV37_ASPC2|nr:U-box domain protein [Aspergillus campestris IBT 28561]PKY01481.1 U-box domain protein [Aspergillus campestris IBT 28561]
MSFELKDKGNRLFKEGDYSGAEDLYSQAIQKNPREPTFFTNRALTRIRLEKWADVEHDARAAIELYGGHKNPASLKSSWYLAQALVGLQRPQEAYDVAIDGYRASLAAQNAQTENLSKIVLRAKQQIWAAKETSRLRELNATLGSVEQLIEADLNRGLCELQEKLNRGEIGEIGCGEDQKALREDAENNINNVREAFRIASKGEVQERIVPDYLVDGITFEIMHDPVITPSGTSFDRVGITKYVQQSGVDPITRVPMTVNDLRSNYALKAACEEFLTKNGWAVDW